MPLIQNPNYNPSDPQSQRFIFDQPTVINPQTGQLSTGGFTTPTITSEALAPVKPIDLPPPPIDTTNYQGIIAGGQSMADYFKTLTEEKPTDLAKMMKDLTTEYGLEQKQTKALESQKQMDILQAQMAALTAEAQAVPIAIQQEYIGRGATAMGVKPLETARLREIALRSLPLQGQILAQQAIATGDQRALEMAQNKFTQVFQIQTKQAQLDYEHRKDLRDKIWDYLTTKEKEKVAALQKKDDQELATWRDIVNDAQAKSSALLATQPDLAAKISARIGQSMGINDKTLATDIAAIMAQVKAKETGQSDFEQAFLRDKGRLPSVEEILDYKRREAAAGKTTTPEIPITPEDKRTLIGVGFSTSEINQIESDISQYGLDKVLEGITDQKQKDAISKTYGIERQVELTRESISKLYNIPDNDEKTAFLSSWFGWGKTNKTKLDEIMDSIKKYQDIGYKDAEILKLIK